MPKARSRSVTTESSARSRAIAQRDIVRDGRGADAAFGADHGDDAADRLGVRRREQAADRAHDVDGADRRDQIVADAAPRQLAVERHVVDAADDDDARAGVADFGELIEAGENIVGAIFRFEDDDVRRRRTAIGFDRGGDAAHLDLDVRLDRGGGPRRRPGRRRRFPPSRKTPAPRRAAPARYVRRPRRRPARPAPARASATATCCACLIICRDR